MLDVNGSTNEKYQEWVLHQKIQSYIYIFLILPEINATIYMQSVTLALYSHPLIISKT